MPSMNATSDPFNTAMSPSGATNGRSPRQVERTVPTDALSATPKAAVAMMVRMLATEEVKNGIRVNAVGPGVIEGGMVPPMRADEQTKNLLASAVNATPMGRLGLVEEVAEMIVFLSSSKASYVTGQRIMVDGGLAA